MEPRSLQQLKVHVKCCLLLLCCIIRCVATTSRPRVLVRQSSSSLIAHALNAQYMFIKRNLIWNEAENECRSSLRGGNLVAISSRKENDFLYRQLVIRKIESAWIGLTDQHSEGDFRWSENKKTKPVYTNWRRRQPNGGLGQNCVEIIPGSRYNKWAPSWNGTWNDIGCEAVRAYICKRSLDIVKPSFIHPREMKLQEHMIVLPGENIHFSCEATSRESTITYHWSKEVQSNSSGQLRLEAILNYYNQSDLMLQNIQQGNVGKYTCVVENVYGNRTANFRLKIFQSDYLFKFATEKTSWINAEKECGKWNGHLVTIATKEKDMYLSNVLKIRENKSAWIGLSSSPNNSNTFHWVNNPDITKNNSRSNNHTKGKQGNNCVELIAESELNRWESVWNGYWNKIGCAAQRPFICEKMIERHHQRIILNNTMSQSALVGTNITSYCNISPNHNAENFVFDWLISNRTLNETWLNLAMRKEIKIKSLRRTISSGTPDYIPKEIQEISALGTWLYLSGNYTTSRPNNSVRYITCLVFNQSAFDFGTIKLIIKDPQKASSSLEQGDSERAYWMFVIGWIGLAALLSLSIFLTTYINIVPPTPPVARTPITLQLSFEEI